MQKTIHENGHALDSHEKIVFAEETFTSLFDEVAPLLRAHHEEISIHKDIILSPSFERYEKLQMSGVLKVFTVRDSGEIIGYASFFLYPSLHFSESMHAVQDAVYIKKDKRGIGLGSQFIDYCDYKLKLMGAEIVYHHVKTTNDWGSLLKKKGYALEEYIYSRRL